MTSPTAGVEGFRLEDLLAPLSIEEFFSEYHDRKPLYLPGAAGKVAHIMSLEEFERLLNMNTAWSPDTLKMLLDTEAVPTARFFRTVPGVRGQPVSRPDPEKVSALLAAGATVSLNDVDQLSPGLGMLTEAMEQALGAKVQANMYFSRTERQAFAVHFDCHDVFAVHIHGEKLWRVYEREDMPIHDGVGMWEWPVPEREKRKGKVLIEQVMKPGDVMYLPRGQYHEALTVSDGSLHISVGVYLPIGLDMANWLVPALAKDRRFRLNLPVRPADGDLAEAVAALGARIADITRDPAFVEYIAQQMAHFRFPRGRIDVARLLEGSAYRRNGDFAVLRRGPDWVLKGANGVVSLPEAVRQQTAWAIDREAFTKADLMATFPSMGKAEAEKFLADLVAMAVVRL